MLAPVLKSKIVLLYSTLLQLRVFVTRWCNIILKVNAARNDYQTSVEKAIAKNTAKMDTINQRSTNGKAQTLIRENI